MQKKTALVVVALMLSALVASVPASAAATLGVTSLGEGISERTGQVYEVLELGKAYTFTLRLDASADYAGGSVRVSVPGTVKLEYNAGEGTAADWRTVTDDGLILQNKSVTTGSNAGIPMRVTLLRAGGSTVKFDFYHAGEATVATTSLNTTWATPISKYAISFTEVPSNIASGASFNFKAYVRQSESAAFNYNENSLVRISVTPAMGGYTIGEREGQKVVESGQSSGSMDFVLPASGSAKTIDYTAMFERDGVYTLTFTLMESGSDGRVIATNSLSLQVGSATVYNPGTGSDAPAGSVITTALPFLTLLLFALVYRQYKRESR